MCAWVHRADAVFPQGVQIDLVLERSDNVINLCEMKYSRGPFLITKSYAEELKRKVAVFEQVENPRKAVHLTLVTTEGVVHNENWNQVQSEVTLEKLFA